MRRACAVLALLLALLAARPAAATIRYAISLDHPGQHIFHVTMTIPKPSSAMTVALPAWNALYQVRDFAYRVRNVQFTPPSEMPNYPFRKIDKQTWEIGDPNAPFNGILPSEFTLSYTIEWNDPGPFNTQLNEHHAFINFAEALMYVPDRRGEDVQVAFQNVPAGWKLIAELPSGPEPSSFAASSYDTLVDAPAEAGKFDEFTFDNDGAHFRVVVDSKDWSKGSLENDLRRITGYELKMMGGPPYKEYTFFFHIGPYAEVGGGGMEHSNGTAISAGSVEGAAAVAAHEFFHAWNVKRICPQALEPVDYTKEQPTRALWFAEGVTSTYASYALERAGLWSKDQFYTDLASQIAELQSRPARLWQSVEESSLDTWFDKYDFYAQPDRSISYYNKGQILGVMLDLAIRDATDNHKSLDDVLRRMNDEYAKQNKFYNGSKGVRAVVEEISGQDFEDFFRRYVAGTDEIPYAAFLADAGLELKSQIFQSADLGFSLAHSPGTGVVASDMEPGSAASAAGLQEGDVIMQMNSRAVPAGRAAFLRELSAGQTIKLRVSRGGRQLDIAYVLGTREDTRYTIAQVAHPTQKQRRIREGLLRGTTD